MEEISTSFCFICLLHLANERGLKLESEMALLGVEEEEEREKAAVGNIWDLKVRPRHIDILHDSLTNSFVLFPDRFIGTRTPHQLHNLCVGVSYEGV